MQHYPPISNLQSPIETPMAENEEGYSVLGESLARIGRVVREVETNSGIGPPEHRRKRGQRSILEGVFTEDLAACDDPNVPTTAKFQIKTLVKATNGWNDEDSPSIVPVLNRTGQSWSEGDVATIEELYPDKYFVRAGGGGGGQRIWFTIVSVECVSATEMILTVQPTWFTGGCVAAIPGQDSYGYVTVEDVCSILLYYTADWLDGTVDGVPKTGSATYMFPRTGYCTPKWLVDEICGSPECA